MESGPSLEQGRRFHVTANQDQRRITFDEDALLYDRARPGYPDALFEDVIAYLAILYLAHRNN